MGILALIFSGITISFGVVTLLVGVGVILDFRGLRERFIRSSAVSAKEVSKRTAFVVLVGYLWAFIGLLATLFGCISLL